jgi:phosphoribosyl 1,2-cyclic phosphate phosphodiesterase
MGFDDLRPFCRPGTPFPVYGSAETLNQIAKVFSFAFEPSVRMPGYLHPDPRVVKESFTLGSVELTPLSLPHGRVTSQGYLMKVDGKPLFAYLTDCKTVPEEVQRAVEGVECLVLDALRERPHPTHQSVSEAVAISARIKPKQTWLTHLCHDHLHQDLDASLPSGVQVAYDGLVIVF